jgi:hypothetical protein
MTAEEPKTALTEGRYRSCVAKIDMTGSARTI